MLFKLEQLVLILYVCASTAGVLIIKNFLNSLNYETLFDFVSQMFDLRLIMGVSLYVLGFVVWLYVLSKMNLNVAYPVAISLSFLAIIICSSLILQEKITMNMVIGYVLCILGIILILR